MRMHHKVTGNKDFAPRYGPSGDEDGTGNCTLTVTPTLWSLLNVLPKDSFQMPHRHQSRKQLPGCSGA